MPQRNCVLCKKKLKLSQRRPVNRNIAKYLGKYYLVDATSLDFICGGCSRNAYRVSSEPPKPLVPSITNEPAAAENEFSTECKSPPSIQLSIKSVSLTNFSGRKTNYDDCCHDDYTYSIVKEERVETTETETLTTSNSDTGIAVKLGPVFDSRKEVEGNKETMNQVSADAVITIKTEPVDPSDRNYASFSTSSHFVSVKTEPVKAEPEGKRVPGDSGPLAEWPNSYESDGVLRGLHIHPTPEIRTEPRCEKPEVVIEVKEEQNLAQMYWAAEEEVEKEEQLSVPGDSGPIAGLPSSYESDGVFRELHIHPTPEIRTEPRYEKPEVVIEVKEEQDLALMWTTEEEEGEQLAVQPETTKKTSSEKKLIGSTGNMNMQYCKENGLELVNRTPKSDSKDIGVGTDFDPDHDSDDSDFIPFTFDSKDIGVGTDFDPDHDSDESDFIPFTFEDIEVDDNDASKEPRPSTSGNINLEAIQPIEVLLRKQMRNVTLLHPYISKMLKSGEFSRPFKLTRRYCVIGRSKSCDIIVSKRGVKPVHLQLEVMDNHVLLYDSGQITRLNDGDSFKLLDRSFKLRYLSDDQVAHEEECDNWESDYETSSENLEPDDDASIENLEPDNDASSENLEPDDDASSENKSSSEEVEDMDVEDVTRDTASCIAPSEGESHIEEHGRSEICGEVLTPGITIQSSVREGKRSQKVQCCVYCGKLVTTLSRHLERKHSNETEVAKVLLLPKKSKARRHAWESIVGKGNFHHNRKVLEAGKGTLITKYRPRKGEEVKDQSKYLPCDSCYSFFIDTDLWKHRRVCPALGKKKGEECDNLETDNETSSENLEPDDNASSENLEPDNNALSKNLEPDDNALSENKSSSEEVEDMDVEDIERENASTNGTASCIAPSEGDIERENASTHDTASCIAPSEGDIERENASNHDTASCIAPSEGDIERENASTNDTASCIAPSEGDIERENASTNDTASCIAPSEGDIERENASTNDTASCIAPSEGDIERENASTNDTASCIAPSEGDIERENASTNDTASCIAPSAGDIERENASTNDTASCIAPSDGESEIGEDGRSEICGEVLTPGITIQRSVREGKRSQKVQCCVYCGKLVTTLSRHLERKHSNETEVAKVLFLPKKSKARRHAWESIIGKGNFHHNRKVLEAGKGTLITKYRPRKGEEVKDQSKYLPCDSCYSFFIDTDLWKHRRVCPALGKKKNCTKNAKREGILQGKLLVPLEISASKGFYEQVFVRIRDDEISAKLKRDPLIIKFGSRLFEKIGHHQQNAQYISQRMRQLAKLLLDMNVTTVEKCISPENWESLIKGVKSVAGLNTETGLFDIPSMPLQLGHSLQTCARILKTEGTIEGNETKVEKAERFLSLYTDEWNMRVSSKALETLHRNKFKKPTLLPTVEDISTFHHYLERQAQELRHCKDSYVELAEVCLAQVISFNRNRSGEVERIKLEDYNSLKKSFEVDKEIENSLSQFEIALLEIHFRIEIRGKKSSKVPVLLTKGMKTNIDIMLGKRQFDSRFLFAKAESNYPLRGADVMRKLAMKSGCKYPGLICSTNLSKQLATISQVLNLSNSDQDLLAKFLGHTIRVHREHFRLPQSTLEVAKVSKILHAVNEGNISELQGKSLDEIQFEDTELEVEQDCGDLQLGEDNFDSNNTTADQEVIQSVSKKYRRRRWSQHEKTAVLRHMKTHLKLKTLPGKIECEAVLHKEVVLAGRTWRQLKDFVRNSNKSNKM